MLEEHIFLKENDIIVSNVRFVFDHEETYAIKGIVYIRLEKGRKKVRRLRLAAGCILLAAGGALSIYYLLAASGFLLLGLLFIMTSIRKVPHGIEIRTAAGDREVYTDTDGEFMERVYRALNEAMIFRG